MRATTIAISTLLLCQLTAGCTWRNGYLLKEYGQRVMAPAPGSPLAGHTVAVTAVERSFDIKQKLTDSPLPEPGDFKFIGASDDQKDQLNDESAAIRKEHEEEEFPTIGWARNLFGAPIANIRALSPPSSWVKELVESGAKGHGARLVDGDAGADLGVTVRVDYLKVDMYMVFMVDLVVNVEFRPRGAAPFTKTYHVYPKPQTAWAASVPEFYEATRRAGQVLMHYVMKDMERAVRGQPVARAETVDG
jgi:hypothetical protein